MAYPGVVAALKHSDVKLGDKTRFRSKRKSPGLRRGFDQLETRSEI
jgi:hypothetical protein